MTPNPAIVASEALRLAGVARLLASAFVSSVLLSIAAIRRGRNGGSIALLGVAR